MKPYVLVVASIAALAPIQAYANPPQTIRFELTVSAGASKCLPNAHGKVIDHTFGNVENLEVVITGLPPFTDFVIFNIEVPNAPFGLAWYNGASRLPSRPAARSSRENGLRPTMRLLLGRTTAWVIRAPAWRPG